MKAMMLCAAMAVAGSGAAWAEEAAPKPDEKTKVMEVDLGKGVVMKFALVGAGKFTMGSPETEGGRFPNETRHEVTLTKDFFLGVTEVTQEQYEAVMGENPSRYKGANLPVDSVSWEHATEFCKALAKKTGHGVRLPTEAEWEYACRAGTTGLFSCGEDARAVLAHVRLGARSPAAAGSLKPNAWGLYDMHGNQWEWVADWFGEYGEKAVTDPTGPAEGALRVLRGGCFHNSPRFCRSAVRAYYPSNQADSDFSFRVVVEPKKAAEK